MGQGHFRLAYMAQQRFCSAIIISIRRERKGRSTSFHSANIHPSLAAMHHSHPLSGSLGGHVYSTAPSTSRGMRKASQLQQRKVWLDLLSSSEHSWFWEADDTYLQQATPCTEGIAGRGPPCVLCTPAPPSIQPRSAESSSVLIYSLMHLSKKLFKWDTLCTPNLWCSNEWRVCVCPWFFRFCRYLMVYILEASLACFSPLSPTQTFICNKLL